MREPAVATPTPRAVNGYDHTESEFRAVIYVPAGKTSHREEIDGFEVKWTSTPNGDGTSTFTLRVTSPEDQGIPFLTSWALDYIDQDGRSQLHYSWHGHPKDWPFEVTIPRLKTNPGIASEYRLEVWEA